MHSTHANSWLASVWGVLMALCMTAIYFESRIQLGHGEAVARLSHRQGVVQIRSQEIAIWSYAFANQRIYNGGVLATGDDGYAEVEFSEGRTLSLEPNTLVVVATAKKQDGNDYVVKLLSGSLAAAPPKTKSSQEPKIAAAVGRPQLIVQVENKVIKMQDAATELAVSKKTSAPAVVTLQKGAAEVVAVDKTQAEEKPILLTEKNEAEKPEPPPALAVVTLSAKALPVLNAAERVQAAAEVAPPAQEAVVTEISEQKPPADPAEEPDDSPDPVTEQKLWTESDLANAGSEAQPRTVKLRMLAVAAWPSEGLPQAEQLDAVEARIDLVSSKDLPLLAPLLAGAEGFSFEPAGRLDERRAFIVRGGSIVAGVDLRAGNQEKWELIRKTFDADFIFAGPRSAMIVGTKVPRRHESGKALGPDSLFMLSDGKLLSIEARLLRDNGAARALIEETAQALFTQSVNILSNR